MAFASFIGPALSAFGAYSQSRAANKAADANAAFQQQQFDYQKDLQAPVVEGAKQIISDPSQFAPFARGIQRSAVDAGIAAEGFAKQARDQGRLGQRGIRGFNELANRASTADLLSSTADFQSPYQEALFRQGADAINARSDLDARNQAVANASGGSSLSGQAARRAAAVEGARASELGKLGTQVGQTAFDKALAEAKAQRQYQLGLAGTLQNVGSTGLNQAQQAYNLTSQAGKSAIDAPFLPFNAYGSTVSGYSLPDRQVKVQQNPVLTGVGAGLTSYQDYIKNKNTGGS